MKKLESVDQNFIKTLLDNIPQNIEEFFVPKDKNNKIVSGDPEKIKKVLDTWKFSKDSRSTNPNWLLIDTQA